MHVTRRHALLALGAALAAGVVQRPTLANLVQPTPAPTCGLIVGTFFWLDNWLYRVITPNGVVARVPVRVMPAYEIDRATLIPMVSFVMRYDIAFYDQDGNWNQYGVDSEPHHLTESMRLLYGVLARSGRRYIRNAPLELPHDGAMIWR